MGSIVNGISAHGGCVKPYGSTFLIFSDYMKASIRLSSLMRIPSLFVFTHDSIGLGGDGPTHQPVEQLASLRAQPNLYVVRPADANETALAYRFALAQEHTPTAIVLTRQAVPVIGPENVPATAVERGAYILHEAERPLPDAILMASGSEVQLCLKAAALLRIEGIEARVVSMPCMDTFTHADEEYREKVLPRACRARVAVEAASPLGWDKWIGEDGCFLGMETFGESGPAPEVYKHFGITSERVVELAWETQKKAGGSQ